MPIFVCRSDNAIKNHYHTIVKQKSLTEDPVAMDAFRAPDSLLYCTPSQNGGLVGAQPVRLFNTPTTMVRNARIVTVTVGPKQKTCACGCHLT